MAFPCSTFSASLGSRSMSFPQPLGKDEAPSLAGLGQSSLERSASWAQSVKGKLKVSEAHTDQVAASWRGLGHRALPTT